MPDQITSVFANDDGSYTFGFSFDNGSGITAATNVNLPAPQATPAVTDDQGNIVTPAVAAIPFTPETAKAAVLPLALAKKQAWLSTLATVAVVGPVTL